MAPQKPAENVSEVSTDDEWETVVEPFGKTFIFETAGDTLIGKYRGNKIVQTDDLNNPGQKTDSTVYEIEDPDSTLWSVWSSYQLEQAFAEIEPGTVVRIRFEGKQEIDGGKRSVKKFSVHTKK